MAGGAFVTLGDGLGGVVVKGACVTTGAGAVIIGTITGPTRGCMATSAQPKNSSCGPQPIHAAPVERSTPQLLPGAEKR